MQEARKALVRALFLFTAIVWLVAAPMKGKAAELEYGKPGDPIRLVVGHACCFTEVWSVYALRHLESFKKYLPKGSTVEYVTGLQSAIIVNAMLAGKAHIGYMGDLVAYTAVTKQNVADIRMVAVVGTGYDQCNVFLVRKDAPQFKDAREAIKWMNGKQVATPKGSCTDMLVQEVFTQNNVKPAAYLNQSIEVISSGFKSGKLDAAAIWEPNASNIELDGTARRVASGLSFDEYGVSYLAMRGDLIKQRPDVVKAWLNAELDAELFLADVKNAPVMIKAIKQHVTGFSDKALWMALYGSYPESVGGTKRRLTMPFVFTPQSEAHLRKGTAFLYASKAINVDKLRPEAVMPEFAEQILKERGLKAPVGEVEALPMSAAPK
jgi:NitT/TauT family transport system substrate-binding protein